MIATRQLRRPRRRVAALVLRDPTRTTLLRRAFIRDMSRRYRDLARDVRVSIVDRDCFGLQDVPRPTGLVANAPTAVRQFAFETTQAKVSGFFAWLEEQQAQGILQFVRPTTSGSFAAFGAVSNDVPWTNLYIDSAYQKAIRLKRAQLAAQGITQLPAVETIAGATFNAPVHASNLAILYSRTFEDLKTATAAANAEARRNLIDGLTTGLTRGLAEGKNPNVIAREIADSVVGRYTKGRHGIVRARAIARTEINRAHNQAAITEFREAQRLARRQILVDVEVGIGDDASICQDLRAAGPYPIDVAGTLLPAHVN